MEAIGAASGAFNTVRQLGGAFGIAITTAVFTNRGSLGSATTFADGFRSAIATAAALAIAGAVIGLLLPRPATRTTDHTTAMPTAQQVPAQ
jgi:cobalamin biosynthesis protein CbiG